MDSSSTAYVLLQYALMIGVILAIAAAIELATGSVPLREGLVVVIVYVGYPWVTRKAGIAPTHWERQ